MTSWIRTTAAPPRTAGAVAVRPFYYQTTEEDTILQFLEFLYFSMYARSQGAPLHIYDKSNAISSRIGLFSSFFKESEGVKFSDSRPPNSISLNGRFANTVQFLATQSFEQLRTAAEDVFTLRPEALTEVQRLMAELPLLRGTGGGSSMGPVGSTERPTTYSVGLYLPRPVRGQTAPLSSLLAMLRTKNAAARRAGGERVAPMTLFILAEDPITLQEFQRQADSSWTLYAYAPKQIPTGSGAALQRVRRDNLYQLITELGILQGCPAVLAPMDSSVGRFLLLTTAFPEGFQATDGASFTPF